MSAAAGEVGVPGERLNELGHLAHGAIYTATPEETLHYFTQLLGMDIVGQDGPASYLRAFGDYEEWSFKIIEADAAGLDHVAWRMTSAAALQRRVAWLEANGHAGEWIEADRGKGPFYQFSDPDGHRFRIYFETTKYTAPPEERPVIPVNHQRYVGRGANVRRLDHVNLLARDVRANREFWEQGFGIRSYEIIRHPDGSEAGAWMSGTIQGHELIYTQEMTSGSGRLHHFAFVVDTREEVLRAAEIMADARIYIEAGPSRHTAIQGFYLYTREPGGNRIEVANGGYLVLDPDAEPYVWTIDEWKQKPGWGAPIPPEFHIYGTPVVEE